ncbi:uncharacterized protein [Diadema antillarum]|uniref:uncharacterized protein n=1 Tax=Diadema antillarum TaxID=105358 RepID=UPI003A84D109
MKEGVMRELLQEREARSSLEKQLEGALAENKTCNAQLEALQGEIARLRSAASLNSLCDNADSCINERLRHGMSSTDTGLSDVERENCNVVVSNKQIEIKMGCKEDKMKEKAMLLERLKQLETENSALVLENENQRDTYEQCLDEVANQVVQALLMQKDLRDECLKLHTKVRDLEHQNRNLRCLFDQNRFTQCIPSPSQYGQRSPYANTSPSLPGRTIPPGPHPASSPSPSPSQSPSPSPCPFATTFTHPLRSKHSAPTQPALTGASKDSGKDPPLSPRLLPSANSKKDHGSSRLRMPDHLRETPQRDSYPKLLRQQFQQYHHLQQQPSSQHQQQRILPQEFYRQLSAPAKYAPHPSQNLSHQGFQQGRGHMHHSSEQGYLPPAFPAYQCDMPGVEGAGEGMGFEDYTWAMNAVDAFPPMRQSSLPAGLGRLGLSDETLNGNLPTAEDLGARITKMQVMGEDRPLRSSPSDTTDSCNGYILGDQYTKPFVHAPFQYAQSLLKELQEISASVKSFESLTLEPKQGSQQKRKAHDGQPAMQRQKLAKNFSPCASNASSESLNSSASPRYLMDSTSSMTSTDSVETTLERIPPVAISQGTPAHRDYNTQWRPEYGGNRLYDSTGSPSRLPPDTPSPPTTDIDPSEKDYQHSKYLRSRQQNVSLAAERERQDDHMQDAPDELNQKGPGEPKACEHPQDRASGSDPPVSVKEKDILNEAQKTVQLMQKENALHCKRAPNQQEKDAESEGHYCCQEAENVRSQVNGRHKEFDDSTESGQPSVKRVGGEVIVESLSCDETSAKHKLNKKLASDCQSHHVESSTTDGVQQVTLPDSESSRSKCPAQPLLREDDPGQDMSSPVWKRKSQVEASNGEEKCESGVEETDREESKDRDVRVASFMAASPMVSKEGETKKPSRPGAKPNTEASPKRHIGKLQSPKHIPKTSLAASKPSALPMTTSKPSGAAELAPRVGSIARADVKVRTSEDALELPASVDARQPKLPVSSTKEVTKQNGGATTCSPAVMQAGNLEPTEKSSERASHGQGVESMHIQKEHDITKQVSSQSNQEANDSLLQKTKQHFTRGEVGQCSLNAKMSQLSKLGPAFLDRPLLSRQGNAVAPMTKYSLDVPVLDSSPRLPGRKQMTSPPHHALSLSPSPDHCRTSLGTPGDMVEFTSQSLEEQASEKSMSTESLQSTNSLGSSADWDSPSKNSTTRKSPTPLSQLLSSDSDSEEEAASVNFVDMWKARSTPPIKLPEWDPNRSIEEHRKRVRESLDRTESTSSASSEQWILNYPLPDDPHSPVVRSSSASPASRQSSLTGVARQDSTNSRKGENSCEEDRRILEELLEKERCAEARVGSGQVTSSCKTIGSDRGSNSKLSSNKNPENSSIMSDFVSSIMAEIRLEDISPGDKSGNVSSKDDCVTRKKSNQVLRSQSMKVTSRPQVTRTQSGEKSKRGDGEGPSAPKSNIPRNRSILDSRKGEAERTHKANTAADPSSENKRKGAGVSRTSLMPKALTRSGKVAQGNPNENQSRSGSGAPTSPNLEKSTLGKVKKLNLKYGKSKAKENESTPKSRSKDSEVKVKDASSDSKGSSSKSKSRIPQLIRQGLKSSPGKSESSKKKNVSSKESAMKSSIPKTSKAENAKTKEASKPVQGDVAGKEPTPLSKTPSFVVDNVPFIDASSKSPNSEVGDHQASSTKSNVPNANSSGQERLKEGPQRPSPKLSPGLLQRLRASGIELANSSGSDNDSVFLPDEPKCNGTPPKPVPTCNGRVARDRSENGSGSELHLDEKEIEDIKNGLLISDTDALSIGSWSAKSSEFGLKSLFLFGNDESSGNNGSPLTHRSLGRGSIGRGSLVPSVTSTPEKSSDGRLPGDVDGDEDEAKRYNVPLVSSDLMEDFEAEDFRQDDAMSSDREKEAQLTEKERANLLDSLFESDDSEECELDGFLEDSGDLSMDSHPGEREFMKLLGEKGLRRQVVRQSVYCRVSLLQMDIFSLYNRFGDPEKEALACFDFLEEMYVSNAGETHFTDDQSLSLISPQNGVGGMKETFGVSEGIRGCLDTSLLQAEDTKSDPFGQDSPSLTLGGNPFHSKSEPPCGARGENSGPSSGEFSEHFDTECFNARHSNKVFDAIGDFGNHLGNRSNLCSSMSSSSTASLSSHE